MTNFEYIQKMVIKKIERWLKKIKQQKTFDALYDTYINFTCYNEDIYKITNVHLCLHCDFLGAQTNCDQNCDKNCKWLYDEYKVKQKEIKKNKEQKNNV